MGWIIEMSFLLLQLPVALSFACVLFFYTRPKQKGPYPPGPPPRFLLGNILDFPRYAQWDTFTKWKEQYGVVFDALSYPD
jgi:hypothetical protein